MDGKQYHTKYHNPENSKFLAIYLGILEYKKEPSKMADYIEKYRMYFPNVTDNDIVELRGLGK